MTKTKSTKRALLMSALALLMCVSMLIGSTFAWFTDSVTSGRNKIVSGNLDVVLEYKTPDSQDEWKEVTSDTVLFGEKGLWEPGHTEVVALRIRNAGTLALKYDLATTVYEEVAGTNVYGDSFKLSDHLEIGYSAINGDGQIGDIFMGMMLGSRDNANSLTNSEFGKSVDNPYPIIMPGDAHVCALAISMPTTVGNEANYKTGTDAPFISFGVTLLATQATVESDSFNNQYDKDATYPVLVSTAEELTEALAAGGNVKIVSDITLSEKTTSSSICAVVNKEVAIDLNGHNITSPDVVFYVLEGGKLTINGDGNLISGNGGTGAAVNVFAYGGEVIINGGTYSINKEYPNAPANHGADMIYAYGGGTITINGGTFKYVENVWTLNLHDNSGSAIIVKGGTFEGFNPANNVSEGLNTNFVADGYVATENNGTWTVTAE